MDISAEDLVRLRNAQPPVDGGLLEAMTSGAPIWLEPAAEHYLRNYIAAGGSKVKLLLGSPGTGKTHMLRWLLHHAGELGYVTAHIDLRNEAWRLSDLVSLYKAVVSQVDLEALLRGLCQRVAKHLGYGIEESYDGVGSIVPLLVEEKGLMREEAVRDLRKAAVEAFQNEDLSPSMRNFVLRLTADHMRGEQEDRLPICWRWLLGEKLQATERRRLHLYDRLTRQTARVWLYSLIRLVRLAGCTGIVVAIDSIETLTERDAETRRYRYTPNATKDTYELVRQVIDDVELLGYAMLLLAGQSTVLEDERRGLRSYEALWMRLQTGLVPVSGFNSFSDIIDVDQLLAAAGGGDFAGRAAQQLRTALLDRGLKAKYGLYAPPEHFNSLQAQVAEVAQTMQAGGAQ